MHHKKFISSNSYIIYPIVLMLLLSLGTVIVVNQAQENQNTSTQAAGNTNCTVSSSQLVTKPQEFQLFNAINRYRAHNEVSPLTWSLNLKQAAAWQSVDMLAHSSLSHTDSLGRTPDIRLTNCGYAITNGYGESIAEGPPSAARIFSAWKNDSSHNKMILNGNYTVAAIDMEVDSSGQIAYWTMDFGTEK